MGVYTNHINKSGTLQDYWFLDIGFLHLWKQSASKKPSQDFPSKPARGFWTKEPANIYDKILETNRMFWTWPFLQLLDMFRFINSCVQKLSTKIFQETTWRFPNMGIPPKSSKSLDHDLVLKPMVLGLGGTEGISTLQRQLPGCQKMQRSTALASQLSGISGWLLIRSSLYPLSGMYPYP